MKNLLIFVGLISFLNVYADDLLYMGDSHSYIPTLTPKAEQRRFGNVLLEGLEARGHKVTYYAACGSAPINWAKGGSTPCGYTALAEGKFVSSTKSTFPRVSSIYSEQKHSQVIFNFGDNMFDWKTVGGKRVAEFNQSSFDSSMTSFLKFFPNINAHNCTWIGPTYHIEGKSYRKQNAVVDRLYTRLETVLRDKCSVVDSRPLVIATVPNDGLHHVNADSQAWAMGVLNHL